MKMTISQVARQAGVGVETVRFYERQGLIDEPPRPDSGYRQYSLDVIKRIQFIKRAQELGFSLKEISELLTLRVEPASTCADVKKQAEAKIDKIERKIEDLLRMKQALVQVVCLCRGEGPVSHCPILDTLDAFSSTERDTDEQNRKGREEYATETSY